MEAAAAPPATINAFVVLHALDKLCKEGRARPLAIAIDKATISSSQSMERDR